MSYDAGGGPGRAPAPGYRPPGDPPPAYPPLGYPGYPPPGYPPPGYPPPYQPYPPPGYQGYPPPGYPPPGYSGPPLVPPALKPGVIPLRPLTLSDIFNGAVAYIRANPKATLGLTTVVVVIAQVVALVLQIGPLAMTGALSPLRGQQASAGALLGSSTASIAGVSATALSAVLLSGMLTVVIGRAVFGAPISIAETWAKVRGRLLALIGFTLLESVGVVALIAVWVAAVAGIYLTAGGGAAFLIALPLLFGLIAAMTYLGTMLSFAPPLIVLERLGIVAAIKRSFALVRHGFWRVLGIRLLAAMVASVVSGAVSIPLSVTGEVMLLSTNASTNTKLVALVLVAVGGAIGQILTAPFSAGVVVLLYTDRRMRAEAFDLVLQTGAASGPAAPADSTDQLWLSRL
jgi:hypothetical protein